MHTYRPKVYTASKLRHAPLWRRMHTGQHWSHVEWTARWVFMDHLETIKDSPPSIHDFAHFWTIDIQDVRRSDFVLLFAMGDDEHSLKGAIAECGAAIALGKQVLVCGHIDRTHHTWTNHPACVHLPNLEEARCFLQLYGPRNHDSASI